MLLRQRQPPRARRAIATCFPQRQAPLRPRAAPQLRRRAPVLLRQRQPPRAGKAIARGSPRRQAPLRSLRGASLPRPVPLARPPVTSQRPPGSPYLPPCRAASSVQTSAQRRRSPSPERHPAEIPGRRSPSGEGIGHRETRRLPVRMLSRVPTDLHSVPRWTRAALQRWGLFPGPLLPAARPSSLFRRLPTRTASAVPRESRMVSWFLIPPSPTRTAEETRRGSPPVRPVIHRGLEAPGRSRPTHASPPVRPSLRRCLRTYLSSETECRHRPGPPAPDGST